MIIYFGRLCMASRFVFYVQQLHQGAKTSSMVRALVLGTSGPWSVPITGKLRYLEFQGNGENTSSFPKFEIANYDVTRIHVHEQKCVHFVSIGFRAFVKSALLQNVCTFVIRCVLPTLFYPQILGSDYNRQNFWTIF